VPREEAQAEMARRKKSQRKSTGRGEENNNNATTSASESQRSRRSSDDWQVIEGTAFQLMNLQETANVADEVVAEHFRAFDENREDYSTLKEAFETLKTERRRIAYLEALHPPALNGITDMLMSDGAPYGRLLAASLKLQGKFALRLPKIVVCGMESEGKSSLLERIAMREMFPRDTAFCTRMPVRLMLRNCRHQNMVIVRFKNTRTNQIVQEVETHTENNQETYSREIATMIADFIRKQHPDDQGDNVDTEHEIQVEIRTPSAPTIDLFDLPGIVSYPEEVHEATKALTERMVNQEHALVVAVVGAPIKSLRNNGIFRVLREADRPVVLALTMVDQLVGQQRLLIDRLNGAGDLPKDIRFTKVVPVVNRDTEQEREGGLGATIAFERATLERVFESGSEGGVAFDGTVHGITGVLHSLNAMLLEYMQNTWAPNEEGRAHVQLQGLLSSLWELGIKPSLLDSNNVKAEIREGYERFLKLPSKEFRQASESVKIKTKIPEHASLVGRLRLRDELISDVHDNAETYAKAVWDHFVNLVIREVFTKSKLPMNLSRIPDLTQGATKVLNDTFSTCFEAIKAELMDTMEALTKTALTEVEDDTLGAEKLDLAIKDAVVTSVLYITLGRPAFLQRMDSWIDDFLETQTFTETDTVKEERKKVEEKVEATYDALSALAEISGKEEDELLYKRTEVFLDAGLTPELTTATHGLTPDDDLWTVAPNQLLVLNMINGVEIPEERLRDERFIVSALQQDSSLAAKLTFNTPAH